MNGDSDFKRKYIMPPSFYSDEAKRSAEAIDINSYIRHNLTVEQQESLHTLQQWMIENSLDLRRFSTFYIHPVLPLLTYLRYNDFDIDTSISQILGNVQRREMDDISGYHLRSPESILNCTREALREFQQVFPQWHCSFDKAGRPVVYKQLAHFRMARVLQWINTVDGDNGTTSLLSSRQRLVNLYIWEQEVCAKLCYQQTVQLQRLVDKSVFVYDLGGMTLNQIRSEFFSYIYDVFTGSQRLYPDSTAELFIINVPPGFSAMWQLFCLPWLDRRVYSRIRVFGSHKQWLPVLEGSIGPENMPENYGGSLVELTPSTPEFAEGLYQEPVVNPSLYASEAAAADADWHGGLAGAAGQGGDASLNFVQLRRIKQKQTHVSSFSKSLKNLVADTDGAHGAAGLEESDSSDEERTRTRVNTLKNELICRSSEPQRHKSGSKSPLTQLFGALQTDTGDDEVARTPTPSRLRFKLEPPQVIGTTGADAAASGWDSCSSGSGPDRDGDRPVRVPASRRALDPRKDGGGAPATPMYRPRTEASARKGKADANETLGLPATGGAGGGGGNEWEAELGFLKEFTMENESKRQLGLLGSAREGAGVAGSFLVRGRGKRGPLHRLRRMLRRRGTDESSAASSDGSGDDDADRNDAGRRMGVGMGVGIGAAPRRLSGGFAAIFQATGGEHYSQHVWEFIAQDGSRFDRPTWLSKKLVESFPLHTLRQYLGASIALYMCVSIGAMVLSVYAIVRTSYVSPSVTLQTWSSVVVLLLSIFLLGVNFVGYVGVRYKNRALLIMYSLCVTTAVFLFSLVALGAGLYSAGIDGYNSSINDRISARAADAVKENNFALAVMCAIGAVCGGFPMVFSSAVIIKLKIEQYTQHRQLFSGVMRISELRVVLKVSVLISAVLALVMIVYGATVVNQLQSTTLSLVLFSVFGLVYCGVALAIATAFAWWVSLTNHHGVVRTYWRVVSPLVTFINMFSSIVAFVTLSQKYSLSSKEFTDSSSSDSADISKAYVVTSLLVTGVLLLFAAGFQIVPLVSARYLYEALSKQNEGHHLRRLPVVPVRLTTSPSYFRFLWRWGADTSAGAAEAEAEGRGRLQQKLWWNSAEWASFVTRTRTPVERVLITWGVVMGLAELFFNGTFVIFSKFISNGGIIGFLYSFLGTVDHRYVEEDPLVVSSAGIMSAVVGPGLLLYAWATFVQAPQRHNIAIVCSAMQIHTISLQYAVEIAQKGESMSSAGAAELGAVVSTLVIFRVIIPAGVIIYETTQAARATAVFDTLAYNQWARAQNSSRPRPAERGRSREQRGAVGAGAASWLVRNKPRSMSTSIAMASSVASDEVPGPLGDGDEDEEPPESNGSTLSSAAGPPGGRAEGPVEAPPPREALPPVSARTGGLSAANLAAKHQGGRSARQFFGPRARDIGEGSSDDSDASSDCDNDNDDVDADDGYHACSDGGGLHGGSDAGGRSGETAATGAVDIASYYHYVASFLPYFSAEKPHNPNPVGVGATADVPPSPSRQPATTRTLSPPPSPSPLSMRQHAPWRARAASNASAAESDSIKPAAALLHPLNLQHLARGDSGVSLGTTGSDLDIMLNLKKSSAR